MVGAGNLSPFLLFLVKAPIFGPYPAFHFAVDALIRRWGEEYRLTYSDEQLCMGSYPDLGGRLDPMS